MKLEPEIAVLTLNNRKIAITHGTSDIIVQALTRSKMFNVVVYGHTHRREKCVIEGTLVINPGEACGY